VGGWEANGYSPFPFLNQEGDKAGRGDNEKKKVHLIF